MDKKNKLKIGLIFLFISFLLLFSPLSLTIVNLPIEKVRLVFAFIVCSILLGTVFVISFKENDFKTLKRKTLFVLIANVILLILLLLPKMTIFSTISLPWLPLKVFSEQSVFFRTVGASLVISFFVFIFLPKKVVKNIKIKKYYIYYLIAFFALAYTILGFLKYNVYAFSALDFGIAIQGIWHYSEFKLAYTTLASTIREGGLLWGDHFHPIWIFAAPLFWIWKDPRFLLIFDAIIVSLGALPIYWLARQKLKNKLSALLLAFGYLAFFGVQFALDFPFRGDTLGITFLAFAIYYLVNKKWGKYTIFILLALMCKENFSMYITFLGIYALIRKNWLPGVLTILAGVGWYFFSIHYFIPAMKIDGTYALFGYKEFGPNLLAAIKNLVAHPLKSLSIFFSPDQKLFAMLAMFSSLSFLPFLAPSALILAIPMLAERFFSSGSHFWETCFHYSVTITPALFFAAILGIKRIKNNKHLRKILSTNKRIILSLSLSVVLSVIFIDLFLRAPLLNFRKASLYQRPKEETFLDEAYKLIPSDVALSTQSSLVPKVSMRRNIFLFPRNLDESEYVFLNTRFHPYPQELVKYIRDIHSSNKWGLIYSKESVLLFKRGESNLVNLSKEVLNFLEKNDTINKN